MSLKLMGCVVFAVLMAAGACAVFAEGTAPQDALQKTLEAEEAKLLKAIETRDRPAIANMLADQVLAVTVDRGRKTTADHIASIASLSVKDYQMSEAKTIQVSPDVAILSFKLSWTVDGGGNPARMTVYATVVWKQVDGQWRSLFYQETPVAT